MAGALRPPEVFDGVPIPNTFVCPDCGMRSFNPRDFEEGWCGMCQRRTGLPGSGGAQALARNEPVPPNRRRGEGKRRNRTEWDLKTPLGETDADEVSGDLDVLRAILRGDNVP